jgi:hypothetical protein
LGWYEKARREAGFGDWLWRGWLTFCVWGMDRVVFLEMLARLADLTEFALKLSQAKVLLREIKANPSVSPFLVNGRIRRTKSGGSSHYTSTFGGFREMLADPKLSLPTSSLPNSQRRKDLLTPGIGIEKKSAPGRPSNYPVLSVLTHEYGHALQPRGQDVLKKKLDSIKAAQDSLRHKAMIVEDNRTLDELIQDLDRKNKSPDWAKQSRERIERDWADVLKNHDRIDERANDARRRASIAVKLTAERDATLRGAEALRRAGAGPKEIGEYFADVTDSKGKVPVDDLMHHSYQGMYDSAKSGDPKVRRGGRRLISPLFPGSMSSFHGSE